MSWQDYFECKYITVNGKPLNKYEYKDKGVEILPSNLPMPPTDTLYGMFIGCQ